MPDIVSPIDGPVACRFDALALPAALDKLAAPQAATCCAGARRRRNTR